MKKLFLCIFVIPLLLTACSDTPAQTNENIVFERSSFDNPGEKELQFILKKDDGSYIFDEDLEINHEQKIHFIITQDNLNHFQHLHPEIADQFWKVKADFPEPGIYNVYADFEEKNEPVKTLFTTITIGDAPANQNYPVVSPANQSIQDGITATMELDSQEANRNITLQFLLQKDGQTIKTLKPYLGAGAHVVILKQNEPARYLHVHPVGNSKNDGKLKFMANFPSAGTYTTFLEVNNDNKIQIFSLTFEIK